MSDVLKTGINQVRNVGRFNIGSGAFSETANLIEKKRLSAEKKGDQIGIVFLVDHFFREHKGILSKLNCLQGDAVEFIETDTEPTTDGIDMLTLKLRNDGFTNPAAIVGMGGGVTMDHAKAVSNLLANGGSAAQYQGWDLLTLPGIFKIGIPTISGTGAEATRTCVMTNSDTGLKLGMNSDFTVFDHVIMDPDLSKTVPRDQYFFTGMDAYIHCIESMAGQYRNAMGDAYCRETINLCRQVFLSDDMQNISNRERLMVASYLGGCAIATSYVGLIHPLSAGLSVVLGIHHCIANCIVMGAMEDYYPKEYDEFWEMSDRQGIVVPKGLCNDLDEATYNALFKAAIMHNKPLTNALGENYQSIMTIDRVIDLYKKM